MKAALPCQRDGCENKTFTETRKGVFVEIAEESCEYGNEKYYTFCSISCAIQYLKLLDGQARQ